MLVYYLVLDRWSVKEQHLENDLFGPATEIASRLFLTSSPLPPHDGES